MSNINDARFAAAQLAWQVYNHGVEQHELKFIIKQIVFFHSLDVNESYFDMVESMAFDYYRDIKRNRSVELFGE